MNNRKIDLPFQSPGLIPSIIEGFNTVASNIYLILFPVIFDLFLWLGPHVRLKSLMEPAVNKMTEQISSINQPGISEIVQASHLIWLSILEQFNLISVFRTYPIGIPSLLSGASPVDTPFGNPWLYEVTGLGHLLLYWFVLTLVGMLMGTIFFNMVGNLSVQETTMYSSRIAWKFSQSIGLTILLVIILFVITIPGMIVLSLLTMINPILAQIVVFFLIFFLIYLLFPLIFSPHGIFTHQINLFSSIVRSIKLVKITLPGTTLFFLILILLGQGLNTLWHIPEEKSWMMMVGIAGHGFISTALLSSSFVYYRKGLSYIEQLHQFNKDKYPNNQ